LISGWRIAQQQVTALTRIRRGFERSPGAERWGFAGAGALTVGGLAFIGAPGFAAVTVGLLLALLPAARRWRLTVREGGWPDRVEYDGRKAAGAKGTVVWLGRGVIDRNSVGVSPDDAKVGDVVDVTVDLDTSGVAEILGTTGSGRTSVLHLITAQWLRAGHEAVVIARNHLDHARLGGQRGVSIFSSPSDVGPVLTSLVEEVRARYDLLAAHRVDAIDALPSQVRPRRILLVLDDVEIRGRTLAEPDEAALRTLIMLGRAVGIHVVAATASGTGRGGYGNLVGSRLTLGYPVSRDPGRGVSATPASRAMRTQIARVNVRGLDQMLGVQQ
jgi:hypothetical protein